MAARTQFINPFKVSVLLPAVHITHYLAEPGVLVVGVLDDSLIIQYFKKFKLAYR